MAQVTIEFKGSAADLIRSLGKVEKSIEQTAKKAEDRFRKMGTAFGKLEGNFEDVSRGLKRGFGKVEGDLKKLGKDYDEFFKVAVYHFEGSESHVYPHLRGLEEHLQVKVSGKHWIDISDPSANKGNALKKLQHLFGISPEETMVFGDFNNDLEMLSEGYFSYAMANAHPNVKKIARFSTSSNDERGVERVLEELLRAKKAVG